MQNSHFDPSQLMFAVTVNVVALLFILVLLFFNLRSLLCEPEGW